jgi:hypothetical protein
MNSKAVLNMFKSAGNDFLKDEAMTQGAAIAFYTALSLAPLLVVLLTGDWLFRRTALGKRLLRPDRQEES